MLVHRLIRKGCEPQAGLNTIFSPQPLKQLSFHVWATMFHWKVCGYGDMYISISLKKKKQTKQNKKKQTQHQMYLKVEMSSVVWTEQSWLPYLTPNPGQVAVHSSSGIYSTYWWDLGPHSLRFKHRVRSFPQRHRKLWLTPSTAVSRPS